MLREIVDKSIPLPTRDERIDMYWLMRDLLLEEESMSEQLVDQYTHTDIHTTNLYILSLNGLNSGQYAGFGPGARSHYGNFGMVNARSIHDYSNAINDHGNAIDVISKSDQIDNYITRLPKRNDKVSINEIALSTNMKFYNATLNELVQNGLMNFDKENYYLTETGLTWYQNLQELLLVPEQRDRHRKSTIVRSEKVFQFGRYFDDIGKSLNDVVC